MVTYMESQTAPSYRSDTCTQRTLRMPNFTRAMHAKPFLSNIPKGDSNFGEPTHSCRTNRLGRNFPTSPQNQNTKLTHCLIYVSTSNNIIPTDKINVVLTLVGRPQTSKHELLEVYSSPQTGPLPGSPGSYLSRLSALNFIQIK